MHVSELKVSEADFCLDHQTILKRCASQISLEQPTTVFLLLLWAVLRQDRGEAATLQHPCKVAWWPKAGPGQRWWVWSNTHKRTQTQAHSLNLSLSQTVIVSQRRRVRRMRVTSSHARCWSVSLSWLLTQSPRRSLGRRRESSDPTVSRLKRIDWSVKWGHCHIYGPI